MTEKYLNINLEDENSIKIAEVLANKTCKKILALIAEQEGLSENDISLKLKIPLNTVDYNVKKLLSSGLIIESKSFFWSVKGKKIKTFKLANKKIIISTKPTYRKILPFVLIAGAAGFAANVFRNIFSASKNLYGSNFINGLNNNFAEKALNNGINAVSGAPQASDAASNLIATNSNMITFSSLFNNLWIWVIGGVLIGIAAFFIYKKISSMKVKGGMN